MERTLELPFKLLLFRLRLFELTTDLSVSVFVVLHFLAESFYSLLMIVVLTFELGHLVLLLHKCSVELFDLFSLDT